MGASDGTSRCREATEHYYDLLRREDAGVPAWIKRHVESCPFCREQVRRLGEILAEADGDAGLSAGQPAQETVAALTAHLELVDEPVTCSQVKPFLPALAAPSQEVKIPTPITVHVDRCPPCARDVAELRALGLSGDQFERLSRVFGGSSRSLLACHRARPAVAALGSFSLEEIDPGALDHISTCPRCRAEVYRRRWPSRDARAQTACRTPVSAADLFNLVVPYGLAPAGREERKAVLTHVRACPACVEAVQALHGLLYGIAERADSGISTVYRTAGRDTRRGEQAGEAVPRYPVHVLVEPGRAGPDDLPPAWHADAGPRSAGARRASLAKAVLAMAAFVLVGLLFTTTPTASGTNIGDIMKAIQREPNIHVLSSFVLDSRPIQEIWVARDLQVFARRTTAGSVLFDLGKRSKKTIDPERGTCTTVKLTSRERRRARESMRDCLGGMFAKVPADTRLLEAAADPAGAAGSQTAIYEFTVTDQLGYAPGPTRPCRYRIYIDRATKLPQRVECFHQNLPEKGWEPSTSHTFEYVTEREVRDAIRAMCLGG